MNDDFLKLIRHGETKIDSLQLHIPIELLKTIKLNNLFLVNENYEILKIYKTESTLYKVDEFETRIFKTSKTVDVKNNIRKEYIIILVASKILGKNYFSGLNYNSIIFLLDILQQNGLFELKFDYEYTLRRTFVNDIDLTIDFFLKETKIETTDGVTFKTYFQKKLYENLEKNFIKKNKLKTKINRGVLVNTAGNMLQINRREGSNLYNPFLKIYDKTTELMRDAQELRRYIYNWNLVRSERGVFESVNYFSKSIMRFEINLHNREMIKRFNFFEDAFNFFNDIDFSKKAVAFFNYCINKYFYFSNIDDFFNYCFNFEENDEILEKIEKQEREFEDVQDFLSNSKPTEIIIFRLLQLLINLGYELQTDRLMNFLFTNFTKQEKYRQKERFTKIFEVLFYHLDDINLEAEALTPKALQQQTIKNDEPEFDF